MCEKSEVLTLVGKYCMPLVADMVVGRCRHERRNT
jgi:hypothetical protein